MKFLAKPCETVQKIHNCVAISSIYDIIKDIILTNGCSFGGASGARYIYINFSFQSTTNAVDAAYAAATLGSYRPEKVATRNGRDQLTQCHGSAMDEPSCHRA